MAQYEWVDVHSLKRWGDPSTEGSIGGNFGSGGTLGDSGIQWGENIDFTSNNLFSYYTENESGASKLNASLNTINFHLSHIYREASRTHASSKSNYTNFIMCEKFDAFKNLNLSNFKTVEFTNLSVDYQHWSLYFVLEDGTMCRTKPYDTPVTNISVRSPLETINLKDTRFLGKLLLYAHRYSCFTSPGTTIAEIIDLYDQSTISTSKNHTSRIYTSDTFKNYYEYKTYLSMIFDSIKFLK